MNYLRSLDEQRDHILVKYGIDTRRAFGTVVLGHPMFVTGKIDEKLVSEAVRTYNSHLSRVEVMTFADLIEGAERSFALSGIVAEDDNA